MDKNEEVKQNEVQFEKFSPIEIQPLKTKKEMKEKLKKLDFSNKFITRLPKLLDQFIYFYKSKVDFKYNILIVSDNKTSDCAEIISSYLYANNIIENKLLTNYNYFTKIKTDKNIASYIHSTVEHERRVASNISRQENNIFSIAMTSLPQYIASKTILDDKFPFIAFDEYSENEEYSLIENFIKKLGFVLENKNDMKKLLDTVEDTRLIKNAITQYIIDKKVDKKDNVIRIKELKEYLNIRLVHDNQESKDKKTSKAVSMENIVGLESVKREVNRIAKMLAKNNGERPMLHMAFLGNPGTGKTSIARVLAQEFYKRKIIKQNKFLEVSRVDLVGEFVGHTASKTLDVIERAVGGILFIDEAYSLATSKSDKDFGPEALATLVKEMEDRRDDLIVIFAGYEKDMKSMIAVNKGLESRIAFHLKFENYSVEELMQILHSFISKTKYTIENQALETIKTYFSKESEKPNFSNGRFVRTFFEKLKLIQAERSDNFEITTEDILLAIKEQSALDCGKTKMGFAI